MFWIELETAHALGVDDISQARLDVQAATGSAKPPGGVLHVLAIGVDTFGDKAGGLHLDYAAEDAHDVATALLESQKGSPGKASLYADVSLTYLPNDKADGTAILDALDDMAQSMAKNEPGQDVAVILVSSHGEMIDGQFYLIPYGFDAGSQNKSIKSAVSASEFAKKVQALANVWEGAAVARRLPFRRGRRRGWATDPDAKVLQDAMDMENVTVLTSSKKNELSEELPDWKHGALAAGVPGRAHRRGGRRGRRPALGADRRDGERGPVADQGPAAPRHACQLQRRPVRGQPLLIGRRIEGTCGGSRQGSVLGAELPLVKEASLTATGRECALLERSLAGTFATHPARLRHSSELDLLRQVRASSTSIPR